MRMRSVRSTWTTTPSRIVSVIVPNCRLRSASRTRSRVESTSCCGRAVSGGVGASGRGGEEFFHERCCGMHHQLGWGPDLFDAAVAQDGNAVGQVQRFVLVVGD